MGDGCLVQGGSGDFEGVAPPVVVPWAHWEVVAARSHTVVVPVVSTLSLTVKAELVVEDAVEHPQRASLAMLQAGAAAQYTGIALEYREDLLVVAVHLHCVEASMLAPVHRTVEVLLWQFGVGLGQEFAGAKARFARGVVEGPTVAQRAALLWGHAVEDAV